MTGSRLALALTSSQIEVVVARFASNTVAQRIAVTRAFFLNSLATRALVRVAFVAAHVANHKKRIARGRSVGS